MLKLDRIEGPLNLITGLCLRIEWNPSKMMLNVLEARCVIITPIFLPKLRSFLGQVTGNGYRQLYQLFTFPLMIIEPK